VGVADCAGVVEELPLAQWERALRIILTGAFLMAKYAVPQMKRRGGGVIINLASVSGLANRLKAMAYSVSKAGLLSLTRSEAIDLARYNIRVNAVSPGSVETELLHEAAVRNGKIFGRTKDEQWQFWLTQYPSERFTQPQEVAELVLFLCSDRATNITGANYVIDGGLTALLPER
jgi:NAD(P)-dependent dehydrogenase (short-subunit alcohol dehydrogenase family)